MFNHRALTNVGVSLAVLLLLAGCSASSEAEVKALVSAPPTPSETPAAPPTVATEDIAALVAARTASLDSAVQGASDCKIYAAADMAGIVKDNAALRVQTDECWAHIDSFFSTGALLGTELQTFVDELSAPAEIAELNEETVNLFSLESYLLSPECRNGSAPDPDPCTDAFGTAYAAMGLWTNKYGPAWSVHTG